jgi:hypothetical protein
MISALPKRIPLETIPKKSVLLWIPRVLKKRVVVEVHHCFGGCRDEWESEEPDFCKTSLDSYCIRAEVDLARGDSITNRMVHWTMRPSSVKLAGFFAAKTIVMLHCCFTVLQQTNETHSLLGSLGDLFDATRTQDTVQKI